jgi:hypothetical protein
VHEVPYLRENAGIALAEGGNDRAAKAAAKRRESHLTCMD